MRRKNERAVSLGNDSFLLGFLSVSEPSVDSVNDESDQDEEENGPDVVYDIDDEVADAGYEILESVDEGASEPGKEVL